MKKSTGLGCREELTGDTREGETMQKAQVEIPLYKCHKEVRAAKITEIQSHESNGVGSHTMVFGDISGSKFLTDEWKARHNPEVGGYFVLYADGYTSYSPEAAFEEGYSKA
jgi:hypothetical protein